RLDAQMLPRDRSGSGSRDRLPLRRPVRRAGEREPECHQLAWTAAVGALLLVRTRAAGAGVEGVGWSRGERRRRPVLPGAARSQQQRRGGRTLLGGDGRAGPLELSGKNRWAAPRGRPTAVSQPSIPRAE